MTPEAIHVIAEAGTNHNGHPELAKKLIDVAKEGGADSVKFQFINPSGLYLPKFFANGRELNNEVFEQRAATRLDEAVWRDLAAYARERGIRLSGSVFDEAGLDLLDDIDAPYIKIASCDLNNDRLIKAAVDRGRPLVISTGMAEMAEISRAIELLDQAGCGDLVLMHCVSVYPVAVEEANVGFVAELRHAFGRTVGFSDHTESTTAAMVALGAGATWFEKHITLDRSSPGFDHAYAAEPATFADYVSELRTATASFKLPPDKLHEQEKTVRLRARRGLYAARELAAGEQVRLDDVLVVRPEAALAPPDLDEVVGRSVRRRIARYEAITWDALQSS